MLIGEAPGMTEDIEGLPFVGQAGKLLSHILFKLGVDEEQVYITNCLRCRPPKNKLPTWKKGGLQEMTEACFPYLEEEFKQVAPKAVVVMGNTPLKVLAQRSFISKHERSWVRYNTIASYHPAAALRNPGLECRIAGAIALACKRARIKIKPMGLDAGMYRYEVRGE
jgi:DNA polymerase